MLFKRRVESFEGLKCRPRVSHDCLEVRSIRLPTQHVAGPGVAGDRRGWITEATFGVANFELATGNALNGLSDLAIGRPHAGTEVENQFWMILKGRDRKDVSLGEVAHVDIVANTRSVWSRVVGAK